MTALDPGVPNRDAGHGVKRTRALMAAAVLTLAACKPQLRAPAPAPSPLRIVAPAPGSPLSEAYPPASLPAEPVKAAVFEQINRDRAEQGVAPVAWDEVASKVADAFCAAQIAERTRGHYLRDGVPPYVRTGLAGVFGYEAQNSSSWLTTAVSFPDTPMELALSAHRSMMEETPPDDGHRRTILDPEATHVGVGWSMSGGRFQIAQEFLTRGLERLTLATETRAPTPLVRMSGAPRSPLRIQFVTMAREALPVPLTQEEANARTSYRYPRPSESYVPEGHTWLRVSETLTLDRIHLGHDRDFSLTFAPQQPGLFTFVFWVSSRGDEQARPGGSAVIRVEE
jgi:uncharacterized protein YkwD